MFVDLERRMHCGMGKCCRCNVGSTYTCLSGPVFDYWNRHEPERGHLKEPLSTQRTQRETFDTEEADENPEEAVLDWINKQKFCRYRIFILSSCQRIFYQYLLYPHLS